MNRRVVVCMLAAVALGGAKGEGVVSGGVSPFPKTRTETVNRYGRWIDLGPRVVDESGAPITGVTATIQRTKADGGKPWRTETAEDGRIPVGGYLSQARFSLEKLGYYSVPGRVIMVGAQNADKDIVMRRVEHPHPMRSIDLSLRLPDATNRLEVAVDLVEGDWMPPYGRGLAADVTLTCVSTNGGFRSCCRLSGDDGNWEEGLIGVEFQRDGDGFVSVECVDDELRLAKSAPEGGYERKTWDVCSWRRVNENNREESIVFRARGRFGTLERPEFRHAMGELIEHVTVSTNDRGSVVSSCSYENGPTLRCLRFRGRVNPVAGERGLEPERPVRSSPGRPEVVPVPADTNLLALGASPDGRSAVFFGRVGTVGAVPEIFERIVYTDSVVRDLPDLEMLFIDPVAGKVPPLGFAGLRKLRTVSVLDPGEIRIESEAFANCPELNLVVMSGWGEHQVAENAFAGGSPTLAALFLEYVPNASKDQDDLPCARLWTRLLDFTARRHFRFAPLKAEADLKTGKVILPRVFLFGDILYRDDDSGQAVLLKRFGKDRTGPLPGEVDGKPLVDTEREIEGRW